MLSAQSLALIDREVAKYPADQKRSAVMGALRIALDERRAAGETPEARCLNPELIEFVANYLGIAPVAAYEVATFYNMYDMKPVGKFKITVCTNLPCALSGGVNAAEYISKKLGIAIGETSADGMYTLLEGECMGACGDAPVLLVNNHKMCSFMTPEAIDKKLAELK
ncbi:NADH-quinone oxidoreductase subunit NuoE [Chromobacterium violaceum]|uniref:NADH-quinone oxidoreductase subunit 2 n=2 Tax=Chromobacterium violaceum TaxID=536 RepID=A0A381ERL0_CHRVL|nr:NADH-quinone oxidoreductase subunit NuoE [Chromobacterium violaceum]AAQ58619.1 NADH-ubiquinone oxidoreductase, chain E [Chromobacterium violaceum ATCC 12472]ATP27703.1 NADH-quinone oxidoreductase subunit NuoE [Chromobacterium violaceum]ATP31616.1 NADH-quinone oxidoreductase subunit NuoE [Chromobacterium violaceum]KJH67464.1 NADH dehydrogenase [Chromobacterium violaceum]KMN49826.1 NADH dehydrogenase [Chromobacterium violaceum]